MRIDITLGLTAAFAVSAMALLQGFTPPPDALPSAEVVEIAAAAVLYREPGEFLSGRTPVNGPIATVRLEAPLAIMRRQVTRGEYDRCAAAGACAPLDGRQHPDLPAVGVSFDDAVAYAAWLSETTGETWRLPTDREWALAAGSRYRDDAYAAESDPDNPARRWLSTYEAETSTPPVDPAPRPVGSFGANEHGLVDLAGNVWEWTSTCYERHRADPAGGGDTVVENCGVRIAEGAHRAYMTSFFRDPKAGACSVGIPPANLGLRLVRDQGSAFEWIGF